MKIALFGGTFDPIHTGHLKAAEVAARRYGLDRVLFVPSGRPPHKTHKPLTDFPHRYAMVTLACARHPIFVPSLLEAPSADGRVNYSLGHRPPGATLPEGSRPSLLSHRRRRLPRHWELARLAGVIDADSLYRRIPAGLRDGNRPRNAALRTASGHIRPDAARKRDSARGFDGFIAERGTPIHLRP